VRDGGKRLWGRERKGEWGGDGRGGIENEVGVGWLSKWGGAGGGMGGDCR